MKIIKVFVRGHGGGIAQPLPPHGNLPIDLITLGQMGSRMSDEAADLIIDRHIGLEQIKQMASDDFLIYWTKEQRDNYYENRILEYSHPKISLTPYPNIDQNLILEGDREIGECGVCYWEEAKGELIWLLKLGHRQEITLSEILSILAKMIEGDMVVQLYWTACMSARYWIGKEKKVSLNPKMKNALFASTAVSTKKEISFLFINQHEAANAMVDIVTNNLAIGSRISLLCNDNIILSPTIVSTSPGFKAGVEYNIPVGFKGTFKAIVESVNYQPFDNVSISCQIAVPTTAYLYPYDLSPARLKEIGPVRVKLLKQVTTEFKGNDAAEKVFQQKSEFSYLKDKLSLISLQEVSYQFPATVNGVLITITVNTNDKIQAAIQDDSNVEKSIVGIVTQSIETHTFGKTCSGDWGNSKNYIHIMGTKNRDLLGYSNAAGTAPNFTISVDATGFTNDGKHVFNTKGKF